MYSTECFAEKGISVVVMVHLYNLGRQTCFRYSPCSTTGVTKAVVCVILSVHIK